MFKVFIYLYIFLESVLCKTWFWLFARSGEAGAALMVVMGGGVGWETSQANSCLGASFQRMRQQPGLGLNFRCSQVKFTHAVRSANGSETALCFQPTSPVFPYVGASQPPWGEDFLPFRQPPISIYKSQNWWKGCSMDSGWFLPPSLPPTKIWFHRADTSISLSHLALAGAFPQARCHPGLRTQGTDFPQSHPPPGPFAVTLSNDMSSQMLLMSHPREGPTPGEPK